MIFQVRFLKVCVQSVQSEPSRAVAAWVTKLCKNHGSNICLKITQGVYFPLKICLGKKAYAFLLGYIYKKDRDFYLFGL